MKEPPGEKAEKPARSSNWTGIALIFGFVLLAILFLFFGRGGNSDQDKLTNAQVAASSPPPRRDKLCASTVAYDQIKRDLFRRAAELRGSDQATFDRLSAVAVARMENPAMESEDSSTGAVNCSGSLSLDLPPGVVTADGRRTLMEDVDYTVMGAADGSGPNVLLRKAGTVVNSLATLRQAPEPGGQTIGPVAANEVATQTAPGAPSAQPEGPQASAQSGSPPRDAGGRSSNCSTLQSQVQIAMCKDPALLALDQNMAAQYSRAIALASPDQRVLLKDTARRFYDFRDRCSTSSCISNAYAGRMREIRDIMQDRWQPPR